MAWFVRVASWASVVNVLVNALGFYWPVLRTGAPRTVLISAVILSIMALNIRGIKQSSFVVNLLTIGKVTPLVIYLMLGLPQISAAGLAPDDAVTLEQVSQAALLLIFAFGGYEVIPVPAGETKDPRRAVPFAMIMTIVIVAILMTLAQIVTLGILPDLGATKTDTPLADAALIFIGGWGALMMTAGASISVAGNNVGAAISGGRSLFALAEQGDVPKIFGHIHARYRTPDVAIVFTCLVTLALALSGTFAKLAVVSAVARLLVYGGTCASVLALRKQGRAPFTIPFGPLIPIVALVVCAGILAGATMAQLRGGAIALAAGAILYVISRRGR
jgi:APA family basic amino acid/polyamine antiporter